MPLGTNPQNISNFTKPEPPDIKKPTFGARFNSLEEARAALRGNSLGTLPDPQVDIDRDINIETKAETKADAKTKAKPKTEPEAEKEKNLKTLGQQDLKEQSSETSATLEGE